MAGVERSIHDGQEPSIVPTGIPTAHHETVRRACPFGADQWGRDVLSRGMTELPLHDPVVCDLSQRSHRRHRAQPQPPGSDGLRDRLESSAPCSPRGGGGQYWLTFAERCRNLERWRGRADTSANLANGDAPRRRHPSTRVFRTSLMLSSEEPTEVPDITKTLRNTIQQFPVKSGNVLIKTLHELRPLQQRVPERPHGQPQDRHRGARAGTERFPPTTTRANPTASVARRIRTCERRSRDAGSRWASTRVSCRSVGSTPSSSPSSTVHGRARSPWRGSANSREINSNISSSAVLVRAETTIMTVGNAQLIRTVRSRVTPRSWRRSASS